MFLYNFLWPKKKEKTDFFLTPAVWPQIAAQSVSLLIDTLYIAAVKLQSAEIGSLLESHFFMEWGSN